MSKLKLLLGLFPVPLTLPLTLNLDQAGVYSVALSFSAKSPGDFSHLATNCNPLPVDTEGRFYAEPKQLTLYRIEIAGIVVDSSIPAGVQNGQAFLKGSLDSIDFSVQWNPADIDTNNLPNLVTWTLIPDTEATLTTLLNNKARLESINPAYTGAITVKAECYSSQAEFTVHLFDGYVVSIQYPYPNRMWCKGNTHPFGGSDSVLLEANLSPGLLTSPSYDHTKIIWSLSESTVGTLTPLTGDHRQATFKYLPASPYVSMVEGDIQITARYDISPFAPALGLTVWDVMNLKWEVFTNPIDENVHPILDNPSHPDYARARTWDNLYNPPVLGEEDRVPPWGGGKRIYPDKNTPAEDEVEAGFQKIVRIKAEVEPTTLSGPLLIFKVFDVDDPTVSRHFFHPSDPSVNHFYEAKAIDAEDDYDANGGVILPKGGDNKGSNYGFFTAFLPNDRFHEVAIPISNGIADMLFVVDVFAGDNYRVGVSCHDDILSLSNNDVPANNDLRPNKVAPVGQVGTPLPGIFSPMLTVWRRLNVEYDSMDTQAILPTIDGEATISMAGELGVISTTVSRR
jgi:hypothetical protein